jgi:hypothetical protein
MRDTCLKEKMVFRVIDFPTSMAYLNNVDIILVLEKNERKVQRIVNGVMIENPLLNVSAEAERGLLGIAKREKLTQYVYLCFTDIVPKPNFEEKQSGFGSWIYQSISKNPGMGKTEVRANY